MVATLSFQRESGSLADAKNSSRLGSEVSSLANIFDVSVKRRNSTETTNLGCDLASDGTIG